MAKLRGFTILELSIVLVVIALVASGVVVGREMVRQAEIRAVMTDYDKIYTAVNSFQNRYKAIPGDMKNATAYWGKNNAACAADSGTASTPGTCNGNGDRVMQAGVASGGTAEMFQFWNHLSRAGVFEGNYSGLAGAGGINEHIGGVNAPSARPADTIWGIWHTGSTFPGTGDDFAIDFGNTIVVGGFAPTSHPNLGAFTPAEAFLIDQKLDDGEPARGKIIANRWNNLCSAADDGSPAANDYATSYRTTDSRRLCALRFRQAF